MVNFAAAGLGPSVTSIAAFHVTPVHDDGKEPGAHSFSHFFELPANPKPI